MAEKRVSELTQSELRSTISLAVMVGMIGFAAFLTILAIPLLYLSARF